MNVTLTIHAPYEGGEDQTRNIAREALHGTLDHLLNLGFRVTVDPNYSSIDDI